MKTIPLLVAFCIFNLSLERAFAADSPRLSCAIDSQGKPVIEWDGATFPGAVLESRTNLTLDAWQAVPAELLALSSVNGRTQARDMQSAATTRFYRLRLIQNGGIAGAYDMGEFTVTELYVSPSGNDDNDGLTRGSPLRHLGAAWSRIPEESTLTNSGFRINLLPGLYPFEEDHDNYFSGRRGARNSPILFCAADGFGTVTISGGLNFDRVSYVYLLDLKLRADEQAAFGNNVLHISQSDHILVRDCTIAGPNGITDTNNVMQEVVKANQTQYLYMENCDASGTFQTVVDYFSVQYGHILQCRLHRSGGRGVYFKGGSAYLLFEGNEVFDCREAGFQAGEGSNFPLMNPPWLHYEAYDIKVVNNVLHDIYGAGLSVSGGYNILMAHNTLYRIGLTDESDRNWTLAQFVRGQRACVVVDEYPSESLAEERCRALTAMGGWGPNLVTQPNVEQPWIPNKNVFIYNNIFFNPSGSSTAYGHFSVLDPLPLPADARNIPSPARADDNLQIKGNIVWNGLTNALELVVGNPDPGCSADNIDCNSNQLINDNVINLFEPQLINPAGGDFHPLAGGNIAKRTSVSIPDFTWDDAPKAPVIPSGKLSNTVSRNRDGAARAAQTIPGAY